MQKSERKSKLLAAKEGGAGQSHVVSFVRCECPGRALAANLGVAVKMSPIQPDKIYLNSCLVNAKPGCPYSSADEVAEMLQNKTGIKVVVKGTHDYQ